MSSRGLVRAVAADNLETHALADSQITGRTIFGLRISTRPGIILFTADLKWPMPLHRTPLQSFMFVTRTSFLR
jgi:hypothetical protein